MPNMITPLFDCVQDDDSVTVRIRAPHSRPRDIDIRVEESDFHFYCRPYLLHLRLPYPVVIEDDHALASYDLESGIASVRLCKGAPGQHFPRLSCLSSLLVSRKGSSTKNVKGNALEPLSPASSRIEVVSSTDDEPNPSGCSISSSRNTLDNSGCSMHAIREPHKDLSEISSCNCSVDPTSRFASGSIDSVDARYLAACDIPVPSSPSAFCSGKASYGFGLQYQDVFDVRAEDVSEMLELSDPDHTFAHQRRQQRLVAEFEAFNPDHYIADYMLAEEFASALEFTPQNYADGEWSIAEKDEMLKLPRRQYLSEVDLMAAADLAGIVFAFCYDVRATVGEHSVESAWTISRISPSISFLDQMPDPQAAVQAAYGRSLVYPLYRHIGIANAVLKDTQAIFASDVETIRKRLLRVLLQARRLFENSLMLRIFNDLYFTDYCVWIQLVDDSVLSNLARDVLNTEIPLESLPWDLKRLETYAVQMSRDEVPDDAEPVWTWPRQKGSKTADGLYTLMAQCSIAEGVQSTAKERPFTEDSSSTVQVCCTDRNGIFENLKPVRTRTLNKAVASAASENVEPITQEGKTSECSRDRRSSPTIASDIRK